MKPAPHDEAMFDAYTTFSPDIIIEVIDLIKNRCAGLAPKDEKCAELEARITCCAAGVLVASHLALRLRDADGTLSRQMRSDMHLMSHTILKVFLDIPNDTPLLVPIMPMMLMMVEGIHMVAKRNDPHAEAG